MPDKRAQAAENQQYQNELNQAQSQYTAQQAGYYQMGTSSDEDIFKRLRRMTVPKHDWWLINALCVIYMLLVFPGLYVMGYSRVNYKFILGTVFGLAFIFCVVFEDIGSRGYDETTTVNSVAIARPLEDGKFEVSTWAVPFVTDGDLYQIRHSAMGNVYSTCQQFERVNGNITSGNDGGMIVDIPPYSSRPFRHRGVMDGPQIELKIAKMEFAEEGDEVLSELELTGTGIPASTKAFAIYNRQAKQLVSTTNGFKAQGQSNVATLLNVPNVGQRYGSIWGGPVKVKTKDQYYNELFKLMLSVDLGLRSYQKRTAFQGLGDDVVYVYIYADMPDEFTISSDQLGKQGGYVLYRFIFDRPESS